MGAVREEEAVMTFGGPMRRRMRTRPRRRVREVRAALLVAGVVVAASCGDDGGDATTAPGSGPDPTSTSTSTTTTTEVDEPPGRGSAFEDPRTSIQLVCAGGPFGVDAVAHEPADDDEEGVETEDSQAGRSLRELLAIEESGGRDVPDRGWRALSVHDSGDVVLHELAHGSPPDLWVAVVQELAEGDRWQGELVEPCTPAPHHESAQAGYWWPTGSGAPDPDATALSVEVQHDVCDSGRGPEGRVTEPEITYGEDAVVVTFFVEPRDEEGAQTCESHPPATVELELDEAVGDRELLDGTTFPAREPSDESPTHIG